MTQPEYIELVTTSDVFNKLSKDMQKKIVKAKGEDMMRYEQIFVTEKNGILTAKKELIMRNDQVVKSFTMEVKTIMKKKAVDDEDRSNKNDERNEEKLLSELDNL